MGSHVARRLASTVLGASVLLPSALAAAPRPAETGATSQATIGLSLSVRPRFDLSPSIRAEPKGLRVKGEGLCVRSTSPSLRFAVTFEPTWKTGDPPPPAPRGSADVPTATPGIACASDAQRWRGHGPGKDLQSVMLLLVSPD